MNRYALRRTLQLAPTLLAVYTLTFFLYHSTPGGPWDRERPVPREAIEQLNRKYGLDRPLFQQYADYLEGVLTRFDFGPSYKNVSRSVSEIIADFFPTSALIGLFAIVLSAAVGIPLGVAAALRQHGALDYGASIISMAGWSLPSFVVGPLLIWLFAVQLGWLPTGGIDDWRHYLLPATTLSLGPLALLARYSRAAMLEVLSAEYVRTARAKGLREQAIVIRHALRNALIPVVTISGILLAEVVVGSFYVETIFAVPGLGRYFVTSVSNRDYPVLMGVTLLFAAIVSIANLAVDLIYAYLDPRIRYER